MIGVMPRPNLPLGRDEKLFLEVVGSSVFEPETHVIGDPRDPRTGTYYIRPFGRPVIESFFGGEGALGLEEQGPWRALHTPSTSSRRCSARMSGACFGPLAASNWSRMEHIGGAYSYALPGQAAARNALARPFDQRLFFAGEATHRHDFTTAHGAYQSGVRAADEVLSVLKPHAP